MIRTMAIVGTGLIGTSVGLAAARHGVTVHLRDRDPGAARAAAALGAGVLEPPREPVDLAVLAVPPSAIGAVLAEEQRRGLARSYTDVASVKAGPVAQVLRHAPAPAAYIGGHPLAGRERSGPLAARGDLFAGRSWVLTPVPDTGQETLNRVLELIALCGATPVLMSGEAHDRAVALTSHAPHAMASLLAARLNGSSADTARLAGQGLRDTTRIAAGDPRLWTDILRANAGPVAEVLAGIRDDLTELVAALDALRSAPTEERGRHDAVLTELLSRGVTGLRDIRARETGPAAGRVPVTVEVGLARGDLARMLAALGDYGVTSDDVRFQAAGENALVVSVAVPAAAERDVRRILARAGWRTDGEIPAPADGPRTAIAGAAGRPRRGEPAVGARS